MQSYQLTGKPPARGSANKRWGNVWRDYDYDYDYDYEGNRHLLILIVNLILIRSSYRQGVREDVSSKIRAHRTPLFVRVFCGSYCTQTRRIRGPSNSHR